MKIEKFVKAVIAACRTDHDAARNMAVYNARIGEPYTVALTRHRIALVNYQHCKDPSDPGISIGRGFN